MAKKVKNGKDALPFSLPEIVPPKPRPRKRDDRADIFMEHMRSLLLSAYDKADRKAILQESANRFSNEILGEILEHKLIDAFAVRRVSKLKVGRLTFRINQRQMTKDLNGRRPVTVEQIFVSTKNSDFWKEFHKEKRRQDKLLAAESVVIAIAMPDTAMSPSATLEADAAPAVDSAVPAV